ncbi:hemolysin family protein [Geomonas subterranea]|uniref:Hemolysin family protein n=1 Tax=Geomonas subterranea TaxID=2847989 RepID=A0ABX8LKG0_9BACT|nr:MULTISPECIES: hemolysin family protein [Geomonas]QXE90834.1 hemolysin family protein [Geomonas subterranea]QXM11083.1 hemolysin family protein [Geomonas subterranea]
MEEGNGRKGQGLIESLTRLLYGKKKVTGAEIQEIMDAGEEEGVINQEENAMIRSILTLGDSMVREIMLPRMEMACVSIDNEVREVLKSIIASGHSRLPVYEGTIDNIIGLIYAKDLLRYWGEPDEAIELRKLIRPPFFIPETKNLEELLHDFKKRRVHMAVVIDEYGGTAGLVTIEDLLEEIVGDIQDEYDLETERLSVQGDGSIVADGRLPIQELEEHFDVEIEKENFETVGGLLFHITGRIPAAGDVIENDPLVLTVLEADERRIAKVHIARKQEQAGESEES